MTIFTATVRIDTDTLEHAQQVLNERTGYDEWLGFDYWITAGDVTPTGEIGWAVFDAVTGEQVSSSHDTRDSASFLCRGLNTRESGGRYHVRTNATGKWERT